MDFKILSCIFAGIILLLVISIILRSHPTHNCPTHNCPTHNCPTQSCILNVTNEDIDTFQKLISLESADMKNTNELLSFIKSNPSMLPQNIASLSGTTMIDPNFKDANYLLSVISAGKAGISIEKLATLSVDQLTNLSPIQYMYPYVVQHSLLYKSLTPEKISVIASNFK